MSSFTENQLNSTTIVNDAVMGRCLEASRNVLAGDVIIQEDALVYGSYDEEHSEYNNDLIQVALSHVINSNDVLDEIILALADLEKIQSEDIAICFLQLLGLHIMKSQGLSSNFIEKMDLLSQLTASHLDKCISDIKKFRSLYPDIIIPSITDDDAGMLLGILNTNEFELEDIQGTGLFVYTAIIQHSCAPNCSFTTSGSHLFLTATEDIPLGTRLSIDYGNYFYHPVVTRRKELFNSYGFNCNCIKCTSSDYTRCFHCEYCNTSSNTASVTPLHESTTTLDITWQCNICMQQPSASRTIQLLEQEIQIISDPPQSRIEIEQILSLGLMKRSHYLIFWSLKDISESLSEEAKFTNSIQTYSEAFEIMELLVVLLDEMLPPVHHEKVIHLDRLAQLAVASGKIAIAREVYTRAYEMSRKACGAEVPCTIELHTLATNTPVSLTALAEHYHHRKDEYKKA
eukprot:gene1615-3115_t